MAEDKKKDKSKALYVRSNTFAAAFSIIFVVMFTVITILTANVNTATKKLADDMKRVNDYQQSATMLQTGTSILAETATSFVHAPVIPDGKGGTTLNTGSIGAYAQELKADRRASTIVALFETYDVSDEIRGYIRQAAEYSTQMYDIQTHAISVVASVHPLPASADFELIPRVGLTEAEQAMDDNARLEYAKSLIAQRDYSLLKSNVSQNIEKCHKALQTQIDKTYDEEQRFIRAMRVSLWAMITLVLIVIVLTVLAFYFWNVRPLQQYAKDMQNNRLLKPIGRVKELRSMVGAYNELFLRRNELESMLRTAAEKDALTGLNNRYSMEQEVRYIEKADCSVAVVLFDVNYLKKVNDTLGHTEGDKLLKAAADNIKEYFGAVSFENCYRIGGDEFAAVLRDCSEDNVKERIKRFVAANESKNISVSIGYAFSEELSDGDFKKLMDIADKRMYEYKKTVHGERIDG